MEAIIHAFGIDWRLIAIQIFNFAILAVALWYFLYTPVLSMIEKRKAMIEKGIADAKAAEKQLESAESEKGAILTAARKEAGEVASRAKEFAAEKTEALLSEAEEKKARILAEAKRDGEEMKAKLYKESEAMIAKTALLAAEKILNDKA